MDHTIIIQRFAYAEPNKTIAVGDSVVWENQDAMSHTATRQSQPSFDTGMIPSGGRSAPQMFSIPSPPNGLEYYCRPHPFMRARLHVKAVEYSEQKAIDFWYEFDANTKYGDPSSPVVQAFVSGLGQAGPFSCYAAFRASRRAPLDLVRFENEFRAYATSVAPALQTIGEFTLATITKHFGDNSEHRQRAFEDFGQGILLDTALDPATGAPRRPELDRLHSMDFGGDQVGDQGIPQAYHAWHAYMRAVVFAGGDPSVWLPLNKLVGLAWGIQSESRPRVDMRNPSPVTQPRLDALRQFWLGMSFESLDRAFDEPFDRPPTP